MRERILNPKISHIEEPALERLASAVYRFIHPDLATFLAVASSTGAFYVYVNAQGNPLYYIIASLFISCHYIFDGIDGKIAKMRGMNRKYGWHIDKVADFVAAAFFISGFFWAITQSLDITVFFVSIFAGFYAWFMYYCSSRNKDVIVGGTESRLILIGLNVLIFSLLALGKMF